jgi:hypothetical protein
VVFTYPQQPLREVLILGAGFSHALSPEDMPLTDELGQLAVVNARMIDDRRVHGGGQFSNGRFEAWLSRLAEDQPDLSTQENYENRALFHCLTRALHSILLLRQEATLASGPPNWLPELLSVLHVRGATVITFNYDCLVEYGVMGHDLYRFGHGKHEGEVLWSHVINDQPPFPPQPARYSGSHIRTFRLLKLHGSLNWYWTPRDETGATLNRWELPGAWGNPEDQNDEERRRHLPGREPFIVPPAATKSEYYRNPLTREMWQQARRALLEARRVALVGYSVLPADLVVSGMIAETLSKSGAVVEVINREPEVVGERLGAIGVRKDSIQVDASGDHAVADFVMRYSSRSALDMSRALRKALSTGNVDTEIPLLVAWSRKAAAAVLDIRCLHNSIELHTEAITPMETATRRRDETEGHPMFMRDLAAVLERDVPLLAVSPGNYRLNLVGAETAATAGIGFRATWQSLTPAGVPPAAEPSSMMVNGHSRG